MRSSIALTASLLLIMLIFPDVHPRSPEETRSIPYETRCGWLVNPTPANIWFYDRDGEWTIGVQGGYQMEGDGEAIPVFKRGQWVKTNVGSYGYGCACLRLRVNKETKEVIEVKSSRARPLSACRNDPSLKKWKSMLK